MPTSASMSTAWRFACSLVTVSSCTRMASAIWYPTVNTGFIDVIGSWKIIAIWLPRYLRISCAGKPKSSSPRNLTEPVMRAERGSRPITAIIVTLLPEPDSPTTPSTLPASMVRSTPRTAFTSPSCVGKVTVRSWISRSACRDVGFTASLPHAVLLRVEGVTQAVADEVHAEADEQQHRAGEVEEPRAVERGALARVDELAERRVRRRHAKAEERERGLEQDGQRDGERGRHHDRPHRVGQHVPEDDAAARRADGARGLDELLLAQREED